MQPDDRGRVGAVLLAAGGSVRLGQPKQLLEWQGHTLLRRAAENALASGASPVIVVLGARAEQIAPTLNGLPVETIVNPAWEEGMASSLRAGIGGLIQATPAVDTALVLLCDQPLITPETLHRLHNALTPGKQAVVSVYDTGATGPPSLFSRDLFPQMLLLTGAQGAKQILAQLPAEAIARVPLTEATPDIDTPADWEKWKTSVAT